MSGEIVSCIPNDNGYVPPGTRWRCDCGVVWVRVCNLGGWNWKVDGHRTKRWATKQHIRWLDTIGKALGSLNASDRAWLEKHL